MINENPNVTRARELLELLSTFTAAEEAAIHQITPMIAIVLLAQGNIGSKGNTSCVWHQSKLNTILPNLPQECKYIVITRQQQNSPDLKSSRFKRDKFWYYCKNLKLMFGI